MDILETWLEYIREGNLREVISIYKTNPDIINKYKIINHGKHKYSTNAIIEASYHGNRDLVKWLIDNEADVNSVFEGGWRPIHFAAQHGHVTTVNWLVLGGADINVQTDNKETPIYLALQSYMRDTVKRLLHHGASLEGIDPNFLHSCIQKEILSYSNLSPENRSYLDYRNIQPIDQNGLDVGHVHNRHNDNKFEKSVYEAEPVKIAKIHRSNMLRDYDHELKRRRKELISKIRRNNESNTNLESQDFVNIVKRIGITESEKDKIEGCKEACRKLREPHTVLPSSQSKLIDQMINLLELSACDSFISSDVTSNITKLLTKLLVHQNNRSSKYRPVSVPEVSIVDFCTKIFDKMTNLQIEQYSKQMLKLIRVIVEENMSESLVTALKSLANKEDCFVKAWSCFFENLGYPSCIENSLIILQHVYQHIPGAVNQHFHDVIDILIGWFISNETNVALISTLRGASAQLQNCWIAQSTILRGIITNLLKDIVTKCVALSRFHRIERDRSQIEELKQRLKHFSLGLTCVSSGISGMSSFHSDIPSKYTHDLSDQFLVETIHKLIDNILCCNKQIDFDNLLIDINTIIINLFSCIASLHNNISSQIWRYIFATLMPLQSRIASESIVNNYNTQLFHSYFTLIELVATKVKSDNQTLIQIFSPSNSIHALMFYGIHEHDYLANKLESIIKVICSDSDNAIILYQIFLSDLELSLNSLLSHYPNKFNLVHLVQNNAFKTKIYSIKHCQQIVLQNLAMIFQMFNVSASISKLFNPTLSNLISKYLAVLSTEKFINKYYQMSMFIYQLFDQLPKQNEPDLVQFTVQYQLNFLKSSVINNVNKQDLSLIKQKFCQLTQVYNSIHKEFLDSNTPLKLAIIETLVFVLNEMDNDDDLQFTNMIYDFVIYLISTVPINNIDIGFKPVLLELITRNCSSADEKIRKKCFVLYFELSLYKDVLNGFNDSFTKEFNKLYKIIDQGRSYKFPQYLSSDIFNWLIGYQENDEKYVIQSRLLDCLVNINTCDSDDKHLCSYLLTLYEVIVNSCWDCVKQKLKLDASVESRLTLYTIENIIKFFLTNGLNNRQNNDKNLSRMMSIFVEKSSKDQAHSICLLIVFVDVLEKMFYNCYSGCFSLNESNKTTEMFFVKNRTVCTEWFGKMRLAIMALAQYSGQWTTVVYQGMQLLDVYSKNNTTGILTSGPVNTNSVHLKQEIEDCIVLTAMALSKLRNWELLRGLNDWAVELYGQKFNWLLCLANKTRGYIEQALVGYEKYIADNHDPQTKNRSEVKLLSRQSHNQSSFILVMEEIAECNLLLCDSVQLDHWHSTIQQWKKNSQVQEAQKSAVNWTRLSTLAKLSKWEDIDDSSINRSKSIYSDLEFSALKTDVSWKYRSILDNCEDQLYLSAVKLNDDCLETVRSQLSQLGSLHNICEYPASFTNPDLILINEKLNYLQTNLNNEHSSAFNLHELSKLSSNLPISLVGYQNCVNKFSQNHSVDFNSRKFLIKWHRTHNNFKQAQQIIDQSFQYFLKYDIEPTSNQLLTSINLSSTKSPEIHMHLRRELAKLNWSQSNKKLALQSLVTTLNDGLFFETADHKIQLNKCKYNTKSLLNLFEWLNSDRQNYEEYRQDKVISTKLNMLIELAEVPWVQGLPIVSPQQRSSEKPCNLPITDVCGQLLILASKSKNTQINDRSFISLAQWCLVRAKAVDDIGLNSSSIREMLNEYLANETQIEIESSRNKIIVLMQHHFKTSKLECEDDWLGLAFDDPEYLSKLRELINNLQLNLTDIQVDSIVLLWLNCVNNHFSLHIAACDAYFSFLRDASTLSIQSNNTISANLRILDLLGKRCMKLRTSIINKIKLTQPSAWDNVIPQIFARLKHPDVDVKRCMIDLLQRQINSARNTPGKSVIYPTLVGLLNIDKASTLPYQEIKRAMSSINPAIVHEVKLFIHELCRITVLWDELWISTLGQAFDELNKKTNYLKLEFDKIDKNQDDISLEHIEKLYRLKYKAAIQSTLYILRRVKSLTNRDPETPRETWFVNNFHLEISNLINNIENPVDVLSFKELWLQIHELQEVIISEVFNKNKFKSSGRHQLLSLADISPNLSKLSANKIPLPGNTSNCNLMKIEEDIYIYPTKTKPKKMKFVGSDGKIYNYLYKGLEDLRLDERIMQILGMVNTMFGNINQCETNKYFITTYSVVPMGLKSGLIEMVDDATSLFALYKRFHTKNKINSFGDTNNTNNNNKLRSKYLSNNIEGNLVSDEAHPIRPADIFWQKLRPKLEPDLINESRDKWPISLLIDVLNELRDETPKDLLSKELWCASVNSNNWFKSTISFARSCAVMCIVGHVIGLGDRHLDNLLVNLCKGNIVHIDYNVCFDKGTCLKVPEKVPFRLTDIIVDVLGPMSTNGLYKITCKKTMEILHESRDNILTLMDTFIFDPIVDWSSNVESGLYGSYEGGRYALSNNETNYDRRMIEFHMNLMNMQYSLLTLPRQIFAEFTVAKDKVIEFTNSLSSNMQIHLDKLQDNININLKLQYNIELVDYMKQCDTTKQENIINNYNQLEHLETQSHQLHNKLEEIYKFSLSQIENSAVFFNNLLTDSYYISFCLDMKNLKPFVMDQLKSIRISFDTFKCDTTKDDLTNNYSEQFNQFIDNTLLKLINEIDSFIQEDLAIVKLYHNICFEMPEQFFNNHRYQTISTLTKKLLNQTDEQGHQKYNCAINEYKSVWITSSEKTQTNQDKFLCERTNWLNISNQLNKIKKELNDKLLQILSQHDDEFVELDRIWQIIIYENISGVNMFKCFLLEQYFDLANFTVKLDKFQMDQNYSDNSFDYDSINTTRNYLCLFDLHNTLWKLLSNYLSAFQIGYSTTESTTVIQMIGALEKIGSSIITMETNFTDIIMPESVKIIRQIIDNDLSEKTDNNITQLFKQLADINKSGEEVIDYFNKCCRDPNEFQSGIYDQMHKTIVEPLQQQIHHLTDINSTLSISNDYNYKQMMILIASFFNSIIQTYTQCSQLIDFCVNMTSPSSWNFLDIMIASCVNISPMWTRSIKLFKDTLFVSAVSCMCKSLINCRELLCQSQIKSFPSTSILNEFHWKLTQELNNYFRLINRHILQSIGSQCFSKMFCVVLELSGWNLDTIVSDTASSANSNSIVINAECLLSTVRVYRQQEYPNALNFLNQLKYRFNKYKVCVNIKSNITSNDLTIPLSRKKFLQRNLSFVNSLYKLAQNQIVVVSWQNQLIDKSQNSDCQSLSNTNSICQSMCQLHEAIQTLSQRRSTHNRLVDELQQFNERFSIFIESIQSINCSTISETHSKLMKCIKTRISTMSDVLEKIEHFQIMKQQNNKPNQFDNDLLNMLQQSADNHMLLQTMKNDISVIGTKDYQILELKQQYYPDDLNLEVWWKKLIERLVEQINESRKNIEKNCLEIEIVINDSYSRKSSQQLTNLLNPQYFRIISQIKPSIKPLESCIKKIQKLVIQENSDHSYQQLPSQNINSNNLDLKYQIIVALFGLLDKFNNLVEGIMKYFSVADDSVNKDIACVLYQDIGKLQQKIQDVRLLDQMVIGDLYEAICWLFNDIETDSIDIERLHSLFGSGDYLNKLDSTSVQSVGSTNHKTTGITVLMSEVSNNVGIQKAIDAWKLVDSRVDRSDDKTILLSKLIRQARNIENLAQMYEGWTAWV